VGPTCSIHIVRTPFFLAQSAPLVKSHSGIIGNEGADHLAHKAAVNQISDVSLPPATDPFYDLWLSVPNKDGSHAEELRVLTNLQDKLKHNMHAHHYHGEVSTDTLLYKLWQKLRDTPERAEQPDSHTQQATAKPLAHAQLSNKLWSMPNVTFKEQKEIMDKPGGASPCNFWTSTIDRIFYFIIGILRLRAINWYINEFNPRRSGGGGVRGVSTFWDPLSRILLGHFTEIINIYLESSAQAQSIGTLFE